MSIEMLDAAYLRRQAELYFSMAKMLSDPVDAQLARAAAERFEQRAKEAEQQQGTPPQVAAGSPESSGPT